MSWAGRAGGCTEIPRVISNEKLAPSSHTRHNPDRKMSDDAIFAHSPGKVMLAALPRQNGVFISAGSDGKVCLWTTANNKGGDPEQSLQLASSRRAAKCAASQLKMLDDCLAFCLFEDGCLVRVRIIANDGGWDIECDDVLIAEAEQSDVERGGAKVCMFDCLRLVGSDKVLMCLATKGSSNGGAGDAENGAVHVSAAIYNDRTNAFERRNKPVAIKDLLPANTIHALSLHRNNETGGGDDAPPQYSVLCVDGKGVLSVCGHIRTHDASPTTGNGLDALAMAAVDGKGISVKLPTDDQYSLVPMGANKSPASIAVCSSTHGLLFYQMNAVAGNLVLVEQIRPPGRHSFACQCTAGEGRLLLSYMGGYCFVCCGDVAGAGADECAEWSVLTNVSNDAIGAGDGGAVVVSSDLLAVGSADGRLKAISYSLPDTDAVHLDDPSNSDAGLDGNDAGTASTTAPSRAKKRKAEMPDECEMMMATERMMEDYNVESSSSDVGEEEELGPQTGSCHTTQTRHPRFQPASTAWNTKTKHRLYSHTPSGTITGRIDGENGDYCIECQFSDHDHRNLRWRGSEEWQFGCVGGAGCLFALNHKHTRSDGNTDESTVMFIPKDDWCPSQIWTHALKKPCLAIACTQAHSWTLHPDFVQAWSVNGVPLSCHAVDGESVVCMQGHGDALAVVRESAGGLECTVYRVKDERSVSDAISACSSTPVLGVEWTGSLCIRDCNWFSITTAPRENTLAAINSGGGDDNSSTTTTTLAIQSSTNKQHFYTMTTGNGASWSPWVYDTEGGEDDLGMVWPVALDARGQLTGIPLCADNAPAAIIPTPMLRTHQLLPPTIQLLSNSNAFTSLFSTLTRLQHTRTHTRKKRKSHLLSLNTCALSLLKTLLTTNGARSVGRAHEICERAFVGERAFEMGVRLARHLGESVLGERLASTCTRKYCAAGAKEDIVMDEAEGRAEDDDDTQSTQLPTTTATTHTQATLQTLYQQSTASVSSAHSITTSSTISSNSNNIASCTIPSTLPFTTISPATAATNKNSHHLHKNNNSILRVLEGNSGGEANNQNSNTRK